MIIVPDLYGDLVLGEEPAPQELVDAVDGEITSHVSIQSWRHGNLHSMGGNHLEPQKYNLRPNLEA